TITVIKNAIQWREVWNEDFKTTGPCSRDRGAGAAPVRKRPRRNSTENLAPVSRWHRHRGRFSGPALPTIRGADPGAQQGGYDRRHLSRFIADEDQRAVLGDAE